MTIKFDPHQAARRHFADRPVNTESLKQAKARWATQHARQKKQREARK